jgi:hypothetical protein
MAGTLSYSQALRVIGQNLMPLGSDRFELVKSGDDYVVRLRSVEEPGASSARTPWFFNKLVGKTRGKTASRGRLPESLLFSSIDVLALDIEHQAKRRTGSPRDARDLSFILRVLGNHLDRRAAREFSISVAPDLIKLRYDQKNETFTPQDLYDFGIQMYLKRSVRP